MGASALKERGVMDSYPVSEQARRRIVSAKTRTLAFEARRILSDGGFRDREIDIILDLLIPYWLSGDRVDVESLRKGLVAKQFRRKEAESIARALAAS